MGVAESAETADFSIPDDAPVSDSSTELVCQAILRMEDIFRDWRWLRIRLGRAGAGSLVLLAYRFHDQKFPGTGDGS